MINKDSRIKHNKDSTKEKININNRLNIERGIIKIIEELIKKWISMIDI